MIIDDGDYEEGNGNYRTLAAITKPGEGNGPIPAFRF